MNRMLLSLVLSSCLLLGSCSSQTKNGLKVAATAVPQAQILASVKEDLYNQGIDLTIIVVDDYQTPNRALANQEIDANFFQHIPYMEEQIAQFGYPIVSVAKIELEPMGVYSNKVRSLADLQPGATIAVPNDPTNEGRALLLLQENGLIKLKRANDLQATIADIVENPKKLKWFEVDAAMLPRTLEDVDAAVINTNYALAASLSPSDDALVVEGKDSPYANVLVVRKGDEKRSDIQALKAALTSAKTKGYILQEYDQSVVPAFDP